MTDRLQLDGVGMRFGPTHALRDVSLRVARGEIVGLIGHNGAGKSTLVNVATGLLAPTAGTVAIDGREVRQHGTAALQRAGVRVIHQEPALAATLSVADNITLGEPSGRRGRGERRRVAERALAGLDPSIDAGALVGTLDFGRRQLVDLARAMAADANVLLLDEPTAALGVAETERLHDHLRRFAADGGAVVYVSHRLRDVLELCTRVVTLREGAVVADRPVQECDGASLARGLAGRDVDVRGVAGGDGGGGEAAGAVRLAVDAGGRALDFRGGEVVGLFGMAGGPQFTLAERLCGYRRLDGARVDGAAYAPRSPGDAVARRVYGVPADRERDGLVHGLSALENLLLPWLDRHCGRFGVRGRALRAVYERAAADLSIRGAAMDAPIEALSGGNRQKVLIGRWLYGPEPAALVLAQPLQGVDVGAREDITRALRRVAAGGTTVVVASSEADEVGQLCDRAYVCDGPPRAWPEIEAHPGWDESLLGTLLRVSEVEAS